TGPTMQEGKVISSQNRRKFGLTGRFTVLPWEDQEDFNLLVIRLRAEHQPTIAFETDLIEKIAQHFWLAQRAVLLQETCFDRKQELHQWAVLLAEAKVDHQQVLTLGARLPVTIAQINEEDRKKAQKAA